MSATEPTEGESMSSESSTEDAESTSDDIYGGDHDMDVQSVIPDSKSLLDGERKAQRRREEREAEENDDQQTVEVPREQFDQLVATVDEMQDTVQEQAARIDELEHQLEQSDETSTNGETLEDEFEWLRYHTRLAQLRANHAYSKAESSISYNEFNLITRSLIDDEQGDLIDDVTAGPIEGNAKAAFADFGDRFRDMEQRITRLDDMAKEQKTISGGKDTSHWMDVVEHAHRVDGQMKHKASGSYVVLYKEDVASAIEPGEKRASQLMDEWGGEVEGVDGKTNVRYQPYKPGGGPNDGTQRKAIKIDIDYWEAP
jgi:hypothetical protein